MTLRPGLGEIAAASLVRCQAPYSGRANCSPMTQIRLCWIMAHTTVLSRCTCHPHPSPDRKGTAITAMTAHTGAPTKSGPMCHKPNRAE